MIPEAEKQRMRQFVIDHPDMTYQEMADALGVKLNRLKHLPGLPWRGQGCLAATHHAQNHAGGPPPKHHKWMSDLEYEWEVILHKAGLGMERGRRDNIVYGFTFSFGHVKSVTQEDEDDE